MRLHCVSGLAQIGILVALFIGVNSARSQLSVTVSAGSLVGEVLSIAQGSTVTLTFENPTLSDEWMVTIGGGFGPNIVWSVSSRKSVAFTITNVQPFNASDWYAYGHSPVNPTGSNPLSTKSGEIRLRVIIPKRLDTPVKPVNGTLQLPIRAADGVTPLTVSDSQFMEVWSTTNLLSTNWVVMPGSVSVTNGIFYLNDAGASNHTQRFYRIIDR